MKKQYMIGLVLALLLALVPSSLAVYSQTINGTDGYDSDRGDIYVVQLSYDPFPASPGQYMDVWYKIENRGRTALQNVEFELLPDYPFSLDPGDDAVYDIGRLDPRQAAVVKYTVRVDENTLQGDHALKYTWRALGRTGAISAPTVSVRTTEPLLVVSSVDVNPEQIAPGQESTIALELTNVGDAFIRYATIRLGLFNSDAGFTTGTTFEELPFAPVGSGSTRSAVNIAPGQKTTLEFTLTAEPDAESKPYKIPIALAYVDSEGTEHTRNEHVGVRVGAEPDMIAYVDKSEIFGSQAPGKVIIRFVNRGVSDIKFLTVTLQETDKFNILSSSIQYVGEVDSDDFETADFTLKLSRDVAEVELPLVLSYQDANNNAYSKGMTVVLPVHSKEALGQASGHGTAAIIVVIILVVAGYFVYRRRKKKRVKRKG